MSKLHGRFGSSVKGPVDPGPDLGTAGFKVTVHSGPGTERLMETESRHIEHFSDRGTLMKQVKQKLETRLHAAERARALTTGSTTTVNASGHTVKTPEGPAMYHRDKQKAALEMAKTLKGADRKFALALAKEHGAEKRRLRGGGGGGGKGQPRVPAGSPAGGQWAKK